MTSRWSAGDCDLTVIHDILTNQIIVFNFLFFYFLLLVQCFIHSAISSYIWVMLRIYILCVSVVTLSNVVFFRLDLTSWNFSLQILFPSVVFCCWFFSPHLLLSLIYEKNLHTDAPSKHWLYFMIFIFALSISHYIFGTLHLIFKSCLTWNCDFYHKYNLEWLRVHFFDDFRICVQGWKVSG